MKEKKDNIKITKTTKTTANTKTSTTKIFKEKIKSGVERFFTPPNVEDIETQLSALKEEKIESSGKIYFSTKNIAIFWLMGMLFALIGYYLFNFLNTLFIIIGAYIISIIMEWIINYFQKKHCNRILAIWISYTIMVVITFLCIIFISPLIIDKITWIITFVWQKLSYLQNLFSTTPIPIIVTEQTRIPEIVKSEIVSSLQNSSSELNTIIQNWVVNMIASITNSIGIFSNIALKTFNTISGFLVKLLMLTFLSVLFSVEKDIITSFLVALFPKYKQQKIELQIQRMYKYLAFWFKYRLALSIFMFTGIYVCFWILYLFGIDISHKFSLALSLGILDVIPYIGPIIAGGLMFFSAIMEHWFWIAMLLPIFVTIVNTTENTVVVPYIMNKSMGVSLILTFVCMLLGWLVMGFLGVFLAIPFAMILTLFFQKPQSKKE